MADIKQHSVSENFIMNCILKVASVIFPLITLPYVTRILLPDGIGKVSFATSVVNYFLMFVQLGIPTYGIRAVAQVRDDRLQLSKTVMEIMIINLIMLLIVGACYILFIISYPENNREQLLYCILGVTLLMTPIGAEWFYSGFECYRYITIRSIIFKAIATFGVFFFVKNQKDYLIYAFFTVFASVGSYICNFINLHNYIDLKKAENLNLLVHIRPILVFCAMSIATKVYTNLDSIMLGIMTNDAEVGYYSTVVKIRTVLLSVTTALGAVLLPRSSYYVGKGQLDNFKTISKKAFHFIWLIASPITIFVIIIANDGIQILGGREFLPAVNALRWIMPTVLLVGLSNLTGIQMLVPMKREKCVLLSVIVGAIVDFLLNIKLIPCFHSAGAAIATLVAEVVVVLVQFMFFEKAFIRELFHIKWLPILFANIIAILICVGVRYVINIFYIRFMLSTIVFFFTYIICLIFFRDNIVIEIIGKCMKTLRNNVQKKD